MPDEQVVNKTKEKSVVAPVKLAEIAVLLTPKVGPLLPEGTAIKLFPGVAESPGNKTLKITNSTEDISAAEAQLARLQLLKEMLSSVQDVNALRQRVKERKELVAKTYEENMQTIFAAQRPLEKTYRELYTFFYEAKLSPSDTTVPGVKIINASADKHFNQLMDNETGLAARIPSKENFDMKNLEGLIVLLDWPGDESKLVAYGKVAEESMAHLFASFPTELTLKEAQAGFEVGGDFAELKSADLVKQHISLVANPLRLRRANRFEKGMSDFYINPTGILAGKVFKGDVGEGLHVAQANKTHAVQIPTVDGSPLEMKWNVLGGKEMKFGKAIIPLAYFEGIVFWGVDNLYRASGGSEDAGFDQYTVKRCDEYIKKTVLHFLNSQVYMPNTQEGKGKIRDALSRFLMANTGERRMLQRASVTAVENAKRPDGSEDQSTIDIRLSIQYTHAVRVFRLEAVSEDGSNWKQKG